MFKIIAKELLAFRKDKRALLLTFFVPIALITLFSLAFGASGDGSDVQSIPLLVVDEDHTLASTQVITDIDSIKMVEPILTTSDTAVNLIKTGKRTAAFILHKGFGDSVKQAKSLPWELKYDEAQMQQTGMLEQVLMQNLYNSMAKRTYGGGGFNWKSMMSKFGVDFGSGAGNDSSFNNTYNTVAKKIGDSIQKSMTGGGKGSDGRGIKMTSVVKASGDNLGIVQAVSGTAVMMLLFSLTAMGGRILEEKENGTLKRLMYSPLSTSEILMGKMGTSIIIASIQLMAMLVYAAILFHLHLWTKLVPVTILVLATAYACSGFGVFLASLVKTRDQLQGLSTLVILTMSALGGSMIPTYIMPKWMQSISPLSVNYWSIQGFYDVFWRQLPVTNLVYLEKIGVLLAIGLVLSLVSFRLFRRNVLSIA